MAVGEVELPAVAGGKLLAVGVAWEGLRLFAAVVAVVWLCFPG